MRWRMIICFGALLLWSTAAQGVSKLPVKYQRNAVVVKLQPQTFIGRVPQPDGTVRTGSPAIDRLNEDYRCVEFERLFPSAQKPPFGRDLVGLSDWYYIEFESDVDITTVLAEYQSAEQVVEAQSIGIHYAVQDFPDDPDFGEQWYLYQDDPGYEDYHIHAPTGWELETGTPDGVVAIVDSGVLWEHPDLRDNIWVNPEEDLDSDGEVWDEDDLNEVDDGGNGFVDDIIGWDFVAVGSYPWPGEDSNLPDNDPRDFNGHGTHCAGIAAAVRNNHLGVAGIAGGNQRNGAKIMALRIGWSTDDGGVERGIGSMTYMAQAFTYATEEGACAINLSYGNSATGGFPDAVANALANGVVVVSSAGNDNDDIPDYIGTVPDAISVAATKKNDGKASYSDYGTWITVSAPGGESWGPIWATYSYHDPDGSNAYTPGYAGLWGTSMASPVVVGLAGIVKSHHPEYDRTQIVPLIVDNADNIDDRLPPELVGLMGSGRVNIYNMLSGLTSADFMADTTYGTAPLTVNFSDASTNVTDGWMYFFGDGDSAAGPNAMHTYQDYGLYDVYYRANGTSGLHTRKKYEYIIGLADTLKFIDTYIFQDSTAPMPVYLANTLPVDTIIVPLHKEPWLGSSAEIIFDSLVFGERTEYFERKQIVSNWAGGGQLAFRLVADNGGGSPPLEPGSGIVAYLWFHTQPDTPGGYEETADSGQVSSYNLLLKTSYLNFKPEFEPATLAVVEKLRGDANLDGAINPLDLVFFVNFVYLGIGEIPLYNGDVNCDGNLNPLDVVHMVNFVYLSIPFPDTCP